MKNEWISVEDRLPNNGINILMFMKNKTHSWSQIGCYDSTHNDWCVCNEQLDHVEKDFYEDVTHWQPLPEPPNV
jgi:hypothetical protein